MKTETEFEKLNERLDSVEVTLDHIQNELSRIIASNKEGKQKEYSVFLFGIFIGVFGNVIASYIYDIAKEFSSEVIASFIIGTLFMLVYAVYFVIKRF